MRKLAATRRPVTFGKGLVRRAIDRAQGRATVPRALTARELEPPRAWARRLASLYPQVRAVWLVGSRGRGTAGPRSDYDFVVSTDAEVAAFPLGSWSDYGELDGVAVEALFVPSDDFDDDALAAVSPTAVLLYARG